MINKEGGGGHFLDFMGGQSCYERGHRAHGEVPPVPPTRENPAMNDSFWKKCSCEPCL